MGARKRPKNLDKKPTPERCLGLPSVHSVEEQLDLPYSRLVRPKSRSSEIAAGRGAPNSLRAIEVAFPVRELDGLARLESYNKNLYRPATYVHKWWARRLGSVFRTIILSVFSDAGEDVWDKYYRGADLHNCVVLDPFMGGGTTVHEALRLGCKVVGVDYNPVAWWSVRQSITMPDLTQLDAAFRELGRAVSSEIQAAYETRCPACSKPSEGIFVLWVKTATCERCGSSVNLHESYLIRCEADQWTLVCPSCETIFAARAKSAVCCPTCEHSFQALNGPAKDGHFVCRSCHTKQRVPKSSDALKPHEQCKMFAIRYRCSRHGEGCKKPDDSDTQNYTKISECVAAMGRSLLVPGQRISDGWKTGDLLTHSFKRWADLFNPRQLFCINLLLRKILLIKDEATRAAFVTLLSGSLEFNNILCTYKGGNVRRPGAVRHIFSHHAFVFPYEMLENNLWGSPKHSGTFPHLYFARLLRAKEYAMAPSERYVQDGRTMQIIASHSESIEGRLASSFEELVHSGKNALLLCGSSDKLELPDRSVDAVVTDPPYSDNVQYGELSDFFYVWLRLALKNRFPEFRSYLAPKDQEIVKNPKQGKDGSFYETGLAAVFRECHRVLKDDGLLVFTFHHKSFEAWANVLSAVLEGGFSVSAAYPIHSEMPLSLHIHKNEAMSYDSILVCHKRGPVKPIAWPAFEEEIYARGKAAVADLSQAGLCVSSLNTFVVVLGKCLQVLSAHYPEVYKDGGETVSIPEALRTAEKIVHEILEGGASATLRDRQPTYSKRGNHSRISRGARV